MVVLTYTELVAIKDAFFDTLIRTPQIRNKPSARALNKVLDAIVEVRVSGVKPKPGFLIKSTQALDKEQSCTGSHHKAC